MCLGPSERAWQHLSLGCGVKRGRACWWGTWSGPVFRQLWSWDDPPSGRHAECFVRRHCGDRPSNWDAARHLPVPFPALRPSAPRKDGEKGTGKDVHQAGGAFGCAPQKRCWRVADGFMFIEEETTHLGQSAPTGKSSSCGGRWGHLRSATQTEAVRTGEREGAVAALCLSQGLPARPGVNGQAGGAKREKSWAPGHRPRTSGNAGGRGAGGQEVSRGLGRSLGLSMGQPYP